MRLLSFDVGIKNMAYCFFDISGEHISVIDWNVVDLMPQNENNNYKCNVDVLKKGSKKKNIPDTKHLCNNKAKFFKGTNYFCDRHAKNSKFLLPLTKYKTSSLNKMKVDSIKQLLTSFDIIPGVNKKNMIEQLNRHFENNMLEQIGKSKHNASNIDLITIGKNIKREFNKIPFDNLDCVIIENQISPIANRMKSIQGMLAQYFIMRFDSIHVEFLSSSNKLKGFSKENDNHDSHYKQHKLDAVFHTKRLLENASFKQWREHVLTHKKIDDLADAFLQGIWYLKTHNIINIA
jgi:galactitol-specific phosphotransferase system IIB component